MELLLNLRFPPGAARDTLDVVVELDNDAVNEQTTSVHGQAGITVGHEDLRCM